MLSSSSSWCDSTLGQQSAENQSSAVECTKVCAAGPWGPLLFWEGVDTTPRRVTETHASPSMTVAQIHLHACLAGWRNCVCGDAMLCSWWLVAFVCVGEPSAVATLLQDAGCRKHTVPRDVPHLCSVPTQARAGHTP